VRLRCPHHLIPRSACCGKQAHKTGTLGGLESYTAEGANKSRRIL